MPAARGCLGVTAQAIRVNGKLLCPRCKVPMLYASERVRDSRGTRITRYYLCPACRSKLVDERMEVAEAGGMVEVRVTVDGRTVIAARVEKHRRR